MRSRFAVTGAAGFIGSTLVRRLTDDGHHVVCIDDLSGGKRENLPGRAIDFRWIDIADPSALELLEHAFYDCDCVFHMAAISSLPECQSNPGRAYAVNVAGTANVLEAARLREVRRVVFSSTGALYENDVDYPSKETARIEPTLVYPLTKKHAEELCQSYMRAYGSDVVMLRYFNVYGPGQNKTRLSPPFTSYVVRQLLNGQTPVLHSDGTQARDYVFVDDVIEANVLAAHVVDPAARVLNVCSGRAHSVVELYSAISAAIDTSIVPKFESTAKFWSSYPSLHRTARPLDQGLINAEVNKYTLGDPSTIGRVLGWSPKVSLSDGIAMLVEAAKKGR